MKREIDEAIKVYLYGNNEHFSPRRYSNAVLTRYGEKEGTKLLSEIETIIKFLVSIRPDFKKLLITSILSKKLFKYIGTEIRKEFPNLDGETVELLAFTYGAWWHTFADSDVSQLASKYDLPILNGPLEPEMNEAIVKYFEYKRFPTDNNSILHAFGEEKGRDLLSKVKMILNEMYMFDPNNSGNLSLSDYIIKKMHERHPELNSEALQSLANDYSFNNR